MAWILKGRARHCLRHRRRPPEESRQRALWTEILRRQKTTKHSQRPKSSEKQTNGWPFFDLTNHSDGGG